MEKRIKALKNQIKEATDAQQKIDAMNALAWEIRDSQTQKAESLSQETLELAKSGKEENTPYQKGIADSLRNLGDIYVRMSNYQVALTNGLEALDHYRTLGLPDGEAEILRIIAAVYDHLGDYPEALDHCLQSITINEEIGNTEGAARSLNQLGKIYFNTGDFDKQITAFERALKIHQTFEDHSGAAINYNNIAMAYFGVEDFDKALKNSKKSLRLAKEFNIDTIMVGVTCTVGEIYLGKGDQKSAKKYFAESLTLSQEIEFKFIELHSLLNLGKIDYQNNEFDSAVDLLLQALSIAEETGEKKEESECHKVLGDVHKKSGEYEKALSHIEKYHQLQKEIFNSQAEGKIKNLEILQEAKVALREKEVKEASESQFQVLFEESPISIWELDWSKIKSHVEELKKDGIKDFAKYLQDNPDEVAKWANLNVITNVNKKTVDLFKAEGKEAFLGEFQPFIHRDSFVGIQSIFAQFAQGELAAGGRLPTITFSGDEMYTENLFSIAQGYEHTWGKVLLSVIDITAEESAKETLKESEALYRSVSEMAHDGIAIIEQGVIKYCNESFATILGRDIDEVVGQPFPKFLHPDTIPDIMEHYQNVMEGADISSVREFTVIKKNEDVITMEVSGSMLEGPPNLRILMIARDITEQKEFEDKLQELATTDSLTGISNRRHFFELANIELERSQRYGHQMGLMLIDIDHFKKINDNYGHLVGDEALKQVVTEVCVNLRSVDRMARYGGEEFVVILPEMAAEDSLLAAERILSKLAKKTFKIEGHRIKVTISIGVTSLGHEDKSISLDELLDQADKALYQSKQAGRNQATVWENEKVRE